MVPGLQRQLGETAGPAEAIVFPGRQPGHMMDPQRVQLGGEFEIGTENPRREWLNGIVLPSAAQFEATVSGTYQLEHIVDHDSKSIPLHVVVGQPTEDDA